MTVLQNKIWLAQKNFSFDQPVTVSCTDELLFVISCFALSGESTAEIMYSETFPFDKNIFNRVGIVITDKGEKLSLSRNDVTGGTKIEIDLSTNPRLAIPLAFTIASLGLEADLTGLENLVIHDEANLVPIFQRELYRFNVITDFCGHSKLKIYDNKVFTLKSRPVDVSQSELLSFFFLSLCFRFGELNIILPGNFHEKYSDAFSAYVKLT